MSEEVLHLSDDQSLTIVAETPEELLVDATWERGSDPPPAHLHPSQDETFEIAEGRLVAVIGDVQRVLTAGETIEIARGTPHKMWNPGPGAARAAWRTAPALRTGEWFRTIDRLTAGGTRKPAVRALLGAVAEFSDVFQLAPSPKPMQPVLTGALRALNRTGLLGH